MVNIGSYKNIFFDRDGIVNNIVMRGLVVGSPRCLQDFSIRPDFIALYERIPHDVNLFVITNQPDLARNLMRVEELDAMHEVLTRDFRFKAVEYCPHDDKDDCRCRKPSPGMIDHLVSKFNLDKKDSLVIGDSVKDIDCAFNAGVDAVFLSTVYNVGTVTKKVMAVSQLNDLIF